MECACGPRSPVGEGVVAWTRFILLLAVLVVGSQRECRPVHRHPRHVGSGVWHCWVSPQTQAKLLSVFTQIIVLRTAEQHLARTASTLNRRAAALYLTVRGRQSGTARAGASDGNGVPGPAAEHQALYHACRTAVDATVRAIIEVRDSWQHNVSPLTTADCVSREAGLHASCVVSHFLSGIACRRIEPARTVINMRNGQV